MAYGDICMCIRIFSIEVLWNSILGQASWTLSGKNSPSATPHVSYPGYPGFLTKKREDRQRAKESL